MSETITVRNYINRSCWAVTFYFASSRRIRGCYIRGNGLGEINYRSLAILNMEINLSDVVNGLFCVTRNCLKKSFTHESNVLVFILRKEITVT